MYPTILLYQSSIKQSVESNTGSFEWLSSRSGLCKHYIHGGFSPNSVLSFLRSKSTRPSKHMTVPCSVGRAEGFWNGGQVNGETTLPMVVCQKQLLFFCYSLWQEYQSWRNYGWQVVSVSLEKKTHFGFATFRQKNKYIMVGWGFPYLDGLKIIIAERTIWFDLFFLAN